MPKCVLKFREPGEVELDLPENPIEAAQIVADVLDQYTGNSLGYPLLYTEEEWAEFQREMDEAWKVRQGKAGR